MQYASDESAQKSPISAGNNVKSPVEEAQALFRRTLSNWVGDLLVLRQSGLLEMTWSESSSDPEYRIAA